MLSYLFEQFHERAQLKAQMGENAAELVRLIISHCAPRPSYRIKALLNCTSYFGEFTVQPELHFFAKGQIKWLSELEAERIETQQKARAHFEMQFLKSYERFVQSELARHVEHLGQHKFTSPTPQELYATWRHFLDGTYGVCTIDGLPPTICLKQQLVAAIDRLLIGRNEKLSSGQLDSLVHVVDALDQVEPLFAPHERARSSRQRCIVNVRKTYLNQ